MGSPHYLILLIVYELINTDVAEEVFNRCAISNEDEFGKDDPNYKITMNYEFLEDFREPKPGRLTRAFTR